jgi:signal transduction histidine kinase
MKTHEKIHGGDNSVVLGSRSRVSRSDDAAVSPGRLDPIRLVADCEDRLHAVRSGLAGVAGALHVLAEEHSELPQDLRQRLEAMLVAEVARLQRLVEPGSGDQQVRPELEPLDIDRVIADVVFARRSAGQEVAWSQTGHTVWSRYDDLVEVLNILLVNARRHAQGAPARIEVVLEGGAILVRVSDDGPGVLPELRQSIFERGVRRPGSRGQGLGLAMARDLVDGLGGSLSLSSTDSGGACFSVLLQAAGRSAAA